MAKAKRMSRAAGPCAAEKAPSPAQAKWRSSGIPDKAAARLRLTALTAAETQGLGSNFHAAASLQIPYFDLDGKPTQFFRVRYLEPLPGFAGQAAKPQRFSQPLGTLNEVYLPPLFKKSWREIAADPTVELFATEGELKAAAACVFGLTTMGFGGVDVWRAGKRGITLLPILQEFDWKNRPVKIVYDSDLATKPGVIRAQRNLAAELLSRGARVEIVNLPGVPSGVLGPNGSPASDDAKQGLDDFLVAHGVEKFRTLVDEAAPFPESDALWSLNEEILYIRGMDTVIERDSGDMYERQTFVGGAYANRHYMETVIKGTGPKATVSLVKKPLAPHWVAWEQRAEVRRITYSPGQPMGELNGEWNMWPGWGCEPKKGDIGPWNWLLDFLFKQDVVARQWFEKWLAYPLQHPGAKMYAACLFWSREQRIGKTFVAYIMKHIYGKNWAEIKSKDLKGTFNSWAKNRQFIYGDEIKGGDAKVDADWFKGLITQDEVTIEEKYLPRYTVPDHMNYFCSSNHPDALFLEDRDQRFLIHEIIGTVASRAEYDRVDSWMRNGGPAALFQHMLDMNLGNFHPREHAPDTAGKRNMILLGKNDTALWVQLLHEDPQLALQPFGASVAQNCDLFTPRSLFKAFDPEGKSRSSEAGLGRAMATGGFRVLNHGIGLHTKAGLMRMYAVRNRAHWEAASRKELVDHFNRFWAPDSTERKL